MSVKFIVIAAAIVLLLAVFIACYTRLIDIDAVLRRNDKPVFSPSIIVYNLDNRFEASRVGEGLIIDGYRLRFFSSCIPRVVVRPSELKSGSDFYISDAAGNKFLLGQIQKTAIKDSASFCSISFDVKDKIVFKSSYSLLPYYYGFFILSPGPVSRYYHYYSFTIQKPSGVSVLLEWKFSTYRGKDGHLVPDLFGDNKEGLVNAVIKEK